MRISAYTNIHMITNGTQLTQYMPSPRISAFHHKAIWKSLLLRKQAAFRGVFPAWDLPEAAADECSSAVDITNSILIDYRSFERYSPICRADFSSASDGAWYQRWSPIIIAGIIQMPSRKARTGSVNISMVSISTSGWDARSSDNRRSVSWQRCHKADL